MLRRRFFIAAGFGLALGGATVALAGNISGDPYAGWGNGGFGTTGTVSAGFGQNSADKAHDVLSHPTGKVIAVGESTDTGQDADFALAAFEPSSGAFDESGFSGDGQQRTDFNGGDDVALGVARAPNNRFVVVGTSESNATSGRFRLAVARYKANGALDRTFSGDGMVRTRMRAGSVEDVAHDVVVRKSKITVAGYSADPSGRRFALARYTEDGALDASFGGDGRVLTSFPGDERTAIGRGIAAAGKGRVVVAGSAFQPGSLDDDFALARYLRNGSRDDSFDSDGRVTTDIDQASVPNRAHDVVVRGNGGVIAGGFSAAVTDDFAFAAYNADGDDIDNFADAAGAGENEVINALALQPSGKLLAAGAADDRFVVLRLLVGNSLEGDDSFSPDPPAGVVYTDFFGDDAAANGMTLVDLGSGSVKARGDNQEQGDPVVAGYSDGGFGGDFALARYHGN